MDLALKMLQIVEEVADSFKIKNMAARIGIHTGRFTGGIAVSDHLKYELYGGDLQVVYEMERNCLKGSVQVSETTKAMLDEE